MYKVTRHNKSRHEVIGHGKDEKELLQALRNADFTYLLKEFGGSIEITWENE